MKSHAKLVTRPASIVVALVIVLCLPAQIAAGRAARQVATGVLYSVEGGTGGGTIRVHDGKRLLRLDYENPRGDRGFKKIEDYHLGAVVTVRFRKDGRELALERMTYTGRFDPTVKSADEFIYNHFALLASCDYELAYKKLSRPLRSRRSFEEFARDYSGAKFSTYASRRWLLPGVMNRYAVPTYGTKFVEHSQRRAVVLVSMFIFIERNFDHYRYVLTRDGDSWSIGEIAAISAEEFESA